MNPRLAAFNALTAVTRGGAYTSLALKEHIPSDMPAESKRFAAALVRTTLENLLKIDYALDAFIKSARVHGSVRNILRLGACQIMFMGTKDYAAVNESALLAKSLKPQTSGFVNAVLRALINGLGGIVYPSGRNAKYLSIEYSYPEWICEKYVADFGFDFTEKLLSYKAPLSTSVRMNALKTHAAEFESSLAKARLSFSRGSVEDSYAVEGMSDIENMREFKGGLFAVQSESSMRAVLAAGIKKGDRLLDCCAAPGGKSAYAAALTDNGIEITAWDVHEHRVEMTKKNFSRLGVKNARVSLRDASVYAPEFEGGFDVVMIDAPCSSMGLMAKNPDIRYSARQQDITALSEKQRAIISACGRYVKPQGTLAYFTCSLNKEENELITDGFIEGGFGFEYVSKQTLFPHICGSDGFYIAVMRRKK